MPIAADTAAWSLRLISELEAIDQRARHVVTGLGPAQLNWRPRPDAWSIGQCLDHLFLANQVYLPAISASLAGRPRRPVQDITPGRFGRWFIRAYIEPNPKGRRVRPPKAIVPHEQVELSILDSFLRSNHAARDLVRLAADHDVNRIRFRNPFIPVIRFTVGTGLEIVSRHQHRHLLQAERVRQSSGFPQP